MKEGILARVKMTKDSFPTKGLVKAGRIHLFEGISIDARRVYSIDPLSGFQAIKPGDIVINRIGLKHICIDVLMNIWFDAKGIPRVIGKCEKEGWTIKDQGPEHQDLTMEQAFEAMKENKECSFFDTTEEYYKGKLIGYDNNNGDYLRFKAGNNRWYKNCELVGDQ